MNNLPIIVGDLNVDDDMKMALIRTQFIQKAYTLVKSIIPMQNTQPGRESSKKDSSLPILSDKTRGRKKNILGVDLENGSNGEKASLKNNMTMEQTEKNESEIHDQNDPASKKIHPNMELIQELPSPTKSVNPEVADISKLIGFSFGQALNPDRLTKEKIISIDELIDSPAKISPPGKGGSPQFKFRPMRSGGSKLIFNKDRNGPDPVSIYNSLVLVFNSGQ